MKALRYIWSAVLALSAASWFYDAVRFAVDNNATPNRLSLVVAFIFTGYLVAKWSWEEWEQASEKN